MSKQFLVVFFINSLFLGVATAESFLEKTEKHELRVTILNRSLQYPWGLAFLPSGELLITEKTGKLWRADKNGRLRSKPVTGLPKNIRSYRQGGLLDVAVHPQFNKNGWIYLSYAGQENGLLGTEVARAKLKGNTLSELSVIFRAQPKTKGGNHFGSRLLFDRQGKLYITLGERGQRPLAQDTTAHPGSVVRLNDDGSVPSDNPFLNNAKVLDELFTYGNRNPQGAALHPSTGRVWIHEHGPKGGDEINLLQAGANYGWPVITYGVNYGIGTKIGEGYEKEGMEQPLHYWTPSIAPSGMAFYSGTQFENWKGNLFVGSLRFQQLVRLQLKGTKVVHEERFLTDKLGRIRDVRVGPNGLIYIITDENEGVLARIEPVLPE